MRHVDAGILALGAVFLLAFVGGVWRTSSLRSDLVERYQQRAIIAQTGLDEVARVHLQRLARQVTIVLGAPDDFDPADVIAEPDKLLGAVKDIARALSARRRVPIYLKWMLRVGPTLVVLLIAEVILTILTFAYFSGWSADRAAGIACLYCMIGVGGAIGMVAVFYAVLHYLFSGAEIRAQPVTA